MATKRAEGTVTPVDQSVLSRVIRGVKFMLSGVAPDSWHGPSQPQDPQAQEKVKGRAFDFPVGSNLQITPRADTNENGISYKELRALADGYDLLRLVIETRKDQISKLDFEIRAKKKASSVDEVLVSDERIEKVKTFLLYPDAEHDWDTWIRAIVEEMLVTDATAIYPRMTRGGSLYSLDLMDGTLIKRIIDNSGRTPLPPEPAYQQILKGIPAVNYSRDELIFRPRNVRVNKVYGYSPVEQVVMTVNIALRRQVTQLQYYTEGNIPEALIGVPDTWTPDQISQFQTWWDEVCSGAQATKSKAKFVPGGMTPTFTKDAILKDGYDEWLARIICFAFNISPQSLVAMMNRATAETAQQQAQQEGLAPLQKWIKNLIDYIIVKYFGEPDIEFVWKEEDSSSPKEQMEVLTGYVSAKILTDDEAREALGKKPLTPEQREALKPPPLPGLDENGKPLPGKDEDGEDGEDGELVNEKDKEEGKKEPVGKSKKVLHTDRNRIAVQSAKTKLKQIVVDAFKVDAKRIAKDLSNEHGISKADKISSVKLNSVRAKKKSIQKQIEVIHKDGAKQAAGQINYGFDAKQLNQLNKDALKYAKTRSAHLITGLEETTRESMKSIIALGIENGASARSLADEIENSFSFSEERALMIATTELAYADVQGNLDAYKESGVVEGKQWIVSQDDFCDDCLELDGVIVGLDEDFPLDGGDGPPLHPNCRCDVIPILVED